MPSKKKTAKRDEPKPPKIACHPIREERIYRLINRYSAPLQSIPEDSTATIWAAVGELKGWMEKKGKKPTDPYRLRSVAWQKLRGVLDGAVEESNSAAFETLSKAWQQWEIKKPSPPVENSGVQIIKDPWKEDQYLQKQKLAENIENLIPASTTNHPNSLSKIKFLEAILDLQRKLKRAPTRREIENKTGIIKTKVSEMVLEMGLEDSLSRTRSPRK
jgi:hypothetical protein